MNPGNVINAPQTVNLAIGVVVFESIAEALSKFEFAWDYQSVWPNIEILASALLVTLWSLKIFVDDHRNFGELQRAGIKQMIIAVFTTVTYCWPIYAASTLTEPRNVLLAMIGFFTTLTIWTAGSLFTRFNIRDANSWAQERGPLRLIWLAFNVINILSIIVLLLVPVPILAGYPFLFGIWVIDVFITERFLQEHPKPSAASGEARADPA